MSNMSYCRFENTLHNLHDCYRALCNSETDDMSKPERDALLSLLTLCAKMADEFPADEVEGDLNARDEEVLYEEFQAWCDIQGLPQMSAEELLHEDITSEQRKYLSDFIHRWEAVAHDPQ